METGVFDPLEFILRVLFGSESPTSILMTVIMIIGLWRMFEKSGLKGWWSAVPVAREYQLARCAGRESEGRTLAVLTFFLMIFQVFDYSLFIPLLRAGVDKEILDTVAALFVVTLSLSVLVYSIRIYIGLVKVYGTKRIWILPWLFFEGITAAIWGFSSKFQPEWKVSDINAEMELLALHGRTTVMDEGLTVNLEERSVREFFQKKVLLRDIHMSIPQGHMVLLLGGSGAGKTTYVNAINGYEKANAEVLLNRNNLYTDYKKMQYNIGFVPQSEMMRGKDTVYNTLLDTAKLRLPRDVTSAQRKARVNEVMEIFGLLPVKDNLVEKLSGGQKKRLSISMEFLSNPDLFILDEPDSGLDGVMARELFEQLRAIADTGKIVVVITHTPDRVIDLFDDVIVLAKDSTRTGRLAYYGSIDDAKAFFGRSTMEQIVKSVNREEEGGEGRADEFVLKYAEVQNG